MLAHGPARPDAPVGAGGTRGGAGLYRMRGR